MAKVSLRAYIHEIEAMIDRGHLDEAIAHCRHILKTFPKHLDTYRLLGKAYLEYKRYGDAADIFTRVLVSSPNDFVANVGLSIIRDEQNQIDDAIWHMERAFETQPSNAAIQSELQRLYGRREGVQPPRIRMTRGALAHMYVQGELYPQAISEIKSVIKEDPGRTDMQVLLAKAYYRSGLKKDAAEAASSVLRSHPYNLDANRILVDILAADKPESAQSYRQRVVELDPYAGQVSSSIFLSNEVPDAAVTIEHLDWNGQPVGMASDWEATQAIAAESTPRRDEQPDWLKSAFGEGTAPAAPLDQAPPLVPSPGAQPADEIPDFLRAAGWGQSTGAFDESKPAFAADEPASAGQPLEQGDLPEWVKALAPQQPAESPSEEEELPDWINQIGTSALPVPSETPDQPDWLRGDDASAASTPSQPADDAPDWLKGIDEPQPAGASAGDEPDWLKAIGETEQTTPASAAGETDWLAGFGSTTDPAATTSGDDLDWLSQLGQTETSPAGSSEAASNEFDFLNQPFSAPQEPASTPATEEFDLFVDRGPQPQAAVPTDDFDFLNPLGNQSAQSSPSLDEFDLIGEGTQASPGPIAAGTPEPAQASSLGASEAEQDDAFAWLEGLAAKQGATEGLLTKPEERRDEEPDWVKQAKGVSAVEEPPTQPTKTVRPAASAEDLGKSTQEQDDSFAWLEGLAAKQGASEGLLTTPEERIEEEPEWIQQAKSLGSQTPETPVEPIAAEPPLPEPAASLESPGAGGEERDDAFAWLENLAAKQGATEGLLTKPEERQEEPPEWVQQAQAVSQSSEPQPEAALEEIPPAAAEAPSSVGEPAKKEQELDDALAWLESLAAKQGATEGLLTRPEERLEEAPDWVKQAQDVDQPSALAETPTAPASLDDTAAWLRSLDEEEQQTSAPTPQPQAESIPDWLMEGQEQETASVGAMEEQLGALDETEVWLRSLEGEQTAPVQPEATPEWLSQNASVQPEEVAEQAPAEEPAALDDTQIWLRSLDDEAATPMYESSGADDTAIWIKSLDAGEKSASEEAEPLPSEDLPAWMQSLEPEPFTPVASQAAATEPEQEPAAQEPAKRETGELPAWLSELDQEEPQQTFASGEDLPAWLREEKAVTEPDTIEPTRSTDWQPIQAEAPQIELEPVAEVTTPAPPPVSEPAIAEQPPVTPQPEPEPVDVVAIIEEKIAAPEPKSVTPAPVKPRREPPIRKVTGFLGDPLLATARSELSRSNISNALEGYSRLIRKGRFLEDIIYDLREASDRFPVDVDIWQSLGDAYMRANRLQDALDAYTKAEELLR